MGFSKAKHNEAACDYLHASAEFPDWVVTTAFYSALHYVCEDIFPLKEDGVTYSDFEEYYVRVEATRKREYQRSKHEVLRALVGKYRARADRYYKALFDRCWNARYSGYAVDRAEPNSARHELQEIKRSLKKIV